ncbi:MAG TPA: cyclic nucleotide-binding domain-containing protein [Candidatus Sumerlaeota bacterium]|nr:cyclic nucleotide-binding domain-containing protein [Candidatus Sumerlaeota bacterium]HPS01726.1 cyclic nucleotide-binding domain-containing protein [Candidatus Sumerlaeota bacterium]
MEPVIMPLAQRAAILRKLEWVAGLGEDELAELARFLLVFQVQRHEVVFREGDAASYFGFVVEGSLDVLKDLPEGGYQELAVLAPGSTFGEMSLIDSLPRSATVLAREDSQLFFLTDGNFYSLVEEAPQVGVKILLATARHLSERLRQTSDWLVEALGCPIQPSR